MRKLITLIAVLLIFIIVVAVGGFFYIDTVAKQAVERGGAYAFGVDTTVDSVNVGLFDGKVELSDLEIDNPEGYDEEFLELEEGELHVGLASLREEIVEVPLLRLDGVNIRLERSQGKTNYDIILENLKKLQSDPNKPGKRYIIREVAINDINAYVNVLPIGGKATSLNLVIDEIRLNNVGSETSGGVVLSDLSGVLLQALLAAIVEKGAGVIPPDMLGDLAGQLAQLPDLRDLGIDLDIGNISKEIGELGETLPGEIDDLGRKAEEGARDLEEGARGAIDDILGGKRNREEDDDSEN